MIAELTVEEASLEWFAELGYAVLHGGDIGPGEPLAERQTYEQVVLQGRLSAAVAKLNPKIAADVRAEAVRKALRGDHPTLIANNRAFHRMLLDGVPVEYRR